MQILKLIGQLIAWLGRACLVLVLVMIALYYTAFAIKVFEPGGFDAKFRSLRLIRRNRPWPTLPPIASAMMTLHRSRYAHAPG